MGHQAERESADLDVEAAGHGGGAAVGGDQSLPAVGSGPVASGGWAGGWAKSAGAGAGDSGGDSTACGTDRGGEKLEIGLQKGKSLARIQSCCDRRQRPGFARLGRGGVPSRTSGFQISIAEVVGPADRRRASRGVGFVPTAHAWPAFRPTSSAGSSRGARGCSRRCSCGCPSFWCGDPAGK